MKHKAARREVLGALAEFERACREFSEGMSGVLQEPAAPIGPEESPLPLVRFGPRKPPRRAARREVDPGRVPIVRR